MSALKWEKLLSPKRIRELLGESPRLAKRSDDTRTEFERDYDRAVFSTPVRRLQDKAQVFPLEPSDYVRTRLTHSLEVSAVARSLAQGAARVLVIKGDLSEVDAHAVETIAATCGLLHDLGNPPFGHAGEDAMQEWFGSRLSTKPTVGESLLVTLGGEQAPRAQDFLQFDGNPQTLRLLAHLQMLADRSGLNLTAATMAAACKYTASSVEVGKNDWHEHSKLGYFTSEKDIVDRVRAETGTSIHRHPITFLVEAADDIVYATVDLEDGIRKGVINWDLLMDQLSASLGAKEPTLQRLLRSTERYVKEGGLALSGSSLDEAHSQVFRAQVVGEHVAAARRMFVEEYDEIMAGNYHRELMKAADTAPLLTACKKVGRTFVYPSKETLKLEIMGRRVIHDLMDLFWEGACSAPNHSTSFKGPFPGKIYSLLSSNYRMLFELDAKSSSNEAELSYSRLQLVTDYIAGMTDTFAITLHRELQSGR